jgi:hypothetical protein
MRVDNDRRDQVIYRGPVSGTGEALSDEDALKILDERVDSSEGEVPDIGVVIATEQSQLQLQRGMAEPRRPDEEGDIGAFGSFPYEVSDWAATRECFGREVPRRIVKAHGLQMSVKRVLEGVCDFPDTVSGEVRDIDTPIILRVVRKDVLIDLTLSPEECRRTDLTLSDLLAKGDFKALPIRSQKR